jgi:hypothetical protein
MSDPSTSTLLLSGVTAAAVSSITAIGVAIINNRSQRRSRHDETVALAAAVLLAEADDMVTQAWWVGSILSTDWTEQKRESLQAIYQANRSTDAVRRAKGSLRQEKRGRLLLTEYEAAREAFKLCMACVAAVATTEGDQPLDELPSDYEAFHQAVHKLQDTAAGRRAARMPNRMTSLRRSITRRLGRAA